MMLAVASGALAVSPPIAVVSRMLSSVISGQALRCTHDHIMYFIRSASNFRRHGIVPDSDKPVETTVRRLKYCGSDLYRHYLPRALRSELCILHCISSGLR